MKRVYTVLIEKGATSYGAYVPDLPGCIAAGKTAKEVEGLIREAIPLHLEGLLRDGDEIPPATTKSCVIEVDLSVFADHYTSPEASS